MITVREFRNMLLQCGEDWNVRLQKWEHCDSQEIDHRQYPMPNLVGVKIKECTSRFNDMGGRIYKFILEDDFDDEFIMKRDQMIDFFCNDKDDYDLLDFVLYVEDETGKYTHIPLTVSLGDKGWNDKMLTIDIDEI